MSLQHEYNDFANNLGLACEIMNNGKSCGGWLLSDFDTWHECPRHRTPGQRHPEDHEDFDDYVLTPEEQEEHATRLKKEDEARFKKYADDDIPF
ncbi:unnamed protein product [marine sediment metagenome]|uniref:Uncharacterized protein n=1 Tax=marine sediment metagenome TaxID=412755 RepID=X0X4K1_9ZZZZ